MSTNGHVSVSNYPTSSPKAFFRVMEAGPVSNVYYIVTHGLDSLTNYPASGGKTSFPQLQP